MTRQQQLDMKPERGRGRGRGKGRGRGRGRGNSSGAKKEKTDKKGKGHDPKGDDESWWDQAWSNEYGQPDEYWAHEDWGSAGWKWDEYAWLEGSSALQEMERKPSQKRRNEGDEDEEEAKQSATKAKKKEEKSRKKQEQETPSGASAENPKKKHKKAKENEEVEIDQVQLKKDTKKIQKYIALFSGKKPCEDVSDKLKEEIRAHLQLSELVEGRLNIYWKRPACGVHSRSQKFDLATFAMPDVDGAHFVSRLAAAVKCAELFVTCLQLTYIYIEKSTNEFPPMNDTEYM